MSRAVDLLEEENARLRAQLAALQERLMEQVSDNKDLKHALERLAYGNIRVAELPSCGGKVLEANDAGGFDVPYTFDPVKVEVCASMEFAWELLREEAAWVYYGLLNHIAPMLEEKIVEAVNARRAARDV